MDAATDVADEPTPLVAGTAQSMTVSGLTPGETYFFALRSQNEEGSISDLSNSPSAGAGISVYAVMSIEYDSTGTFIANGDVSPSITKGSDFGDVVVGETTSEHVFVFGIMEQII